MVGIEEPPTPALRFGQRKIEFCPLMPDVDPFSSSADLDPWAHSAERIRLRRFTMRRKGYDPEEVHRFLEQVGDWFEATKRRLQTLERQARGPEDLDEATGPTSAEPSVDPYAQVGGRVADMLREMEQYVRQTSQEAEVRAQAIVEEATEEAERVAQEARRSAEETDLEAQGRLRETEARVDRMLADVLHRRKALLDHLESVRQRLGVTVEDLGETVALLRIDETPEATPDLAAVVVLPEAGDLEERTPS